MKPTEYLEQLQGCAERNHFGESTLRPCSAVDIMSVEREVGFTLPEQYVDFLCQVGAGKEHGGLAYWFHTDVTIPGNILDHSHAVMTEQIRDLRAAGLPVLRYPKNMLIIYDSCDGAVFGFLPETTYLYKPEVYCWDLEERELEECSPSFFDFLDYLCQEGPGNC